MTKIRKHIRRQADKPKRNRVVKPYDPTKAVKVYMTKKPTVVPSDTGVQTAFWILQTKGFKQLLVMDRGKLVGIVSDRDFRKPEFGDKPADKVEYWEEYYRISDLYKVKDIRTSNVITINENAPLIDAVRIFKQKKFNALPVLSDSGKLVVILTVHDILSSMMSSYQRNK
jgi:acetoin utilization protein AcuB